jgi:antitoxin YefM
MRTISYTTLRNNLSKAIDQVNEDRAPLLVTRQNGEPAVLLSLADFNAFSETVYLMRSPANAKRLLKAANDVNARRKIRKRRLAKTD